MQRLSFIVAPYALFDVLKALHLDDEEHRRLTYSVGKEDGELVVFVSWDYSSTPPSGFEIRTSR